MGNAAGRPTEGADALTHNMVAGNGPVQGPPNAPEGRAGRDKPAPYDSIFLGVWGREGSA